MNANEIIKDILKSEGVKQTQLGEKIGMTAQRVHNLVVSDNMTVSTLLQMTEALGYKIYVTKDNCNGYLVGGDEVPAESTVTDDIARLKGEAMELLRRIEDMEGR